MHCPACGAAMATQRLEGRYGTHVDLDLCYGCAAFWFDGTESLALTSCAVLELFAAIHEHRSQARNPLPRALACPRCHQGLIRTTDRQRNTPFCYWRCPQEDGRFTSFFDFLREKNFVRPLAPRELAALKENVQTLTCSSCGAPVDLAHDSACPYCRAPIALLDAKQVEAVLEEVQRGEAARQAAVAELPLRLCADRAHVDRVFDQLGRDPEWASARDSLGLLEGALGAVASLLR